MTKEDLREIRGRLYEICDYVIKCQGNVTVKATVLMALNTVTSQLTEMLQNAAYFERMKK